MYSHIHLCIFQNKHPRCCSSDALHELTQKPYENHLLFQKECGQSYDFCGEANNVSRTNCACIIHVRTIILLHI